MSKRFWIGIDVSKKTFHAAVADRGVSRQAWGDLPCACFDNSRKGMGNLVRWVREQGVAVEQIAGVCLEATGRFGRRWAEAMENRLGPVSIVNPAHPVGFARSLGIRDKTDRTDACVLALFGKAHQPHPTPPESPRRIELRELFRFYRALQTQCLGNQQRLQDLPDSALVRRELRRSIHAQEKQLQRLQEAMDRLIDEDPELRRQAALARTIPGVGPKTVLAILAELGDVRQYKRNEIVALVGLYPREYTSGTSVYRKPRLAKGGHPAIRASLYMGAMTAKRLNPQLGAFALRLQENGKNPMQILGALMRKLLLLVRAVIVSGNPYDPAYGNR